MIVRETEVSGSSTTIGATFWGLDQRTGRSKGVDLLHPLRFAQRRTVALGLGAALLALGLVDVFAYRSLVGLLQAAEQVEHTHAVVDRLEQVSAGLNEVHGGARSFVLTGQDRDLEAYQSGLRALGEHIATLRQLTNADARQQERLDALVPLMAIHLHAVQESVAVRRARGFSAAQHVVLTDRGGGGIDTIRGALAEIWREQRQLLALRVAARELTAQHAIWSVVVASLLAAALVSLAAFAIGRDRRTSDVLRASGKSTEMDEGIRSC